MSLETIPDQPYSTQSTPLSDIPSRDSHSYSFQEPNFVLVNSQKYFGDILPFYYGDLPSWIITSWSSLSQFILHSQVFLVCLFSLIEEVFNNGLYQSYLLLLGSWSQIVALPDRYNFLKVQVLDLMETLSKSETRELWWLEIKLDSKNLILKIQTVLNSVFRLAKKFYLTGLVIATLGILNSVSLSSTIQAQQNQSFLSRFFDNYSYSSVETETIQELDPLRLSRISVIGAQIPSKNLDKIVKHKVAKGETIETIAEKYSISVETIKFNNNIKNPKKLPKEVYLPWRDGYIYVAKSNITPKQLEDIYKINKNTIYSENEDSLNQEKGEFPKGSLIFLPTTDYKTIAKLTQKEKERQEQLRRLENASENRPANVSSYSLAVTRSTQSKSEGFIWPASGFISRCIQPGHIACDIANPASPPIFAVQSGTIKEVYRFTVRGYGLGVLIDHGNGFETLYAHMSQIYVTRGQKVTQGQAIGQMGCTGYCTGTHVHFEIRYNGVKQNPLIYLK